MQKTIDDAISLLNEAFKLDPKALEELTFKRVNCNNSLADHPSIQVYAPHNNFPQYEVGLLGILNGIFGTELERIAVSISSTSGEILGFTKVKPNVN